MQENKHLMASFPPIGLSLNGSVPSYEWIPTSTEKPARSSSLPIFFALLMAFQCSLLHPRFRDSSPLQWLRFSLAPLTITWWFFYPFRYAVTPIEANYAKNTARGFIGIVMTFKAIEWSFTKGPYYTRKLKTVDGRPRWEKGTEDVQPTEKCSWAELVWWTIVQGISQRGLRFSWGPASDANTRTLKQTLVGILRLQLINLPATAFLLFSQSKPFGSPHLALLSLGVPSIPGLAILARCLHSVCFGLQISSGLELSNSVFVATCHMIHPLIKATHLPVYVTEAFDPINFPPLFNSLFNLSSLAYFWGKSWHSKARRYFLVCGGKPATKVARAFGARPEVQSLLGLLGVFAISGVLHEYPFWVVFQPPHPTPRVFLRSFPGSFLFFFVQALGIIIEPFVIKHIPKNLGGGKLWTVGFLMLTVPMFSKDACGPGGYLEFHRKLNEWDWKELLLPGPWKLLR